MLPLSHRDISNGGYSSHGNYVHRLKDKVNNYVRIIFADRNSKNLFLFLILNFSFAFVELIYGWWSNSLGLISDSFHMFFDCTGLLGLYFLFIPILLILNTYLLMGFWLLVPRVFTRIFKKIIIFWNSSETWYIDNKLFILVL